jgi:hypothetical protein
MKHVRLWIWRNVFTTVTSQQQFHLVLALFETMLAAWEVNILILLSEHGDTLNLAELRNVYKAKFGRDGIPPKTDQRNLTDILQPLLRQQVITQFASNAHKASSATHEFFLEPARSRCSPRCFSSIFSHSATHTCGILSFGIASLHAARCVFVMISDSSKLH